MAKGVDRTGGRKPPPPEYRFLKGKSGNPNGRPRGSVNLSKAVRKIASKRVPIAYGERKITQSVLGHVLEALKREAARGRPAMIELLHRIHSKLNPQAADRQGGFLIVPEGLTTEEWIAQAKDHNARHTRDPSLPAESYPESQARTAALELKQALVLAEVKKARMGLPSPLGEAMLAYERKWGESYNPV